MTDTKNLTNAYGIELLGEDENRLRGGFDVCLAIASLELPLHILTSHQNTRLNQQLMSLTDFELAQLYYCENFSLNQLEQFRTQYVFYLKF